MKMERKLISWKKHNKLIVAVSRQGKHQLLMTSTVNDTNLGCVCAYVCVYTSVSSLVFVFVSVPVTVYVHQATP